MEQDIIHKHRYIRFGIVVRRLPAIVGKSHIHTISKQEPDALAKALQSFFRKQAKEVLPHVKSHKKADWFNVDEQAEAMAKAVMPTVQIYYDHAAKTASTQIAPKQDQTTTLDDGQEVSFRERPNQGVMMMVDPAKLDEDWQKDGNYYIPPGGGGAEIGGRRAGFESFLEKNEPIEASKVMLHKDKIQFEDGRHRFSVLRDKGAEQVAVMVDRSQVGEFIKRYDAKISDLFTVVQPNIDKAMKQAVLRFCKETNETTSLELKTAREQLRGEIEQGLIEGDVKTAMLERVKAVFDSAENSRAWAIATTEASRGQHAAAEITAKESGVVKGKRWLLSSDACPECLPLANKVVPLDANFVVNGKGPYAAVPFPPAHPHCRCDMVFET